MVVGLVSVEFVRAAARSSLAAPDRWHRIQRWRQHAAVVPVGPTDGQAKRRALAMTTRWRLVPALPRSIGLGPVSEPPFEPARRRCRAKPAANPGDPLRADAPAERGAGPPRPRRRATPPADASRSCRCSPSRLAHPATGCPSAAQRGCPPAPPGLILAACRLWDAPDRVATAARSPPRDRQELEEPPSAPNAQNKVLSPVLSRTPPNLLILHD